MRQSTVQFQERAIVSVAIRNANASAALVDGQPVFFSNYDVVAAVGQIDPAGSYNATAPTGNFGVDVTRYSEVPATQSADVLFAGIYKSAALNQVNAFTANTTNLAVGAVGEAICYGFTDAIITRRTRAATTDSWASFTGFSAGQLLLPETVGNGFSDAGTEPLQYAIPVPAGSTGQTLTVTLPRSPVYGVVAAQSAVNKAGTTSSWTGASGLADTIRMKVFVRIM